MQFTPGPPPPPVDDPADAEPDVMFIGGHRSLRWWTVSRWVAFVAVIGGALGLLFLQFGTPVLWAGVLVGFMVAYMLLMGRWAGDEHRRP